MELSPGQQRLLFVLVVVALVGLGIFLIEGQSHGTTAAPASKPTASASASASAATANASGPVASGTPVAVPPATVPPFTPPGTPSATAGSGGANIYQWLPFTQSDLTAAAKTTLAFATDYVTWNSTELPAAYGATMANLVTPGEDATLEGGFSSAAQAAGNAVSTGSGAIDSITAFGANPASITFSVAIAQQVVPSKGTSTSPSQYNITVISTGTGWQVNSIELSNLGDE
jgi:hypothetical protein